MFYGSIIFILVQASCYLCGGNTAVKKEEGKILSIDSEKQLKAEYFSTKFEVFGKVKCENSLHCLSYILIGNSSSGMTLEL